MVFMKAEQLLKRVADGDRSAFEKLYNDYVRLIYATVYSVTKNVHDAEDLTAEVFITVWKKASGYNGGNGKSWLCAIAKNHDLTFIKKRDRERTVITDEYAFGSYEIGENAETKSIVNDALAVLNDEERETVLMFNAGLKHREIAVLNGEPLGTVTWRYNNALKKMRKFLQGGEI